MSEYEQLRPWQRNRKPCLDCGRRATRAVGRPTEDYDLIEVLTGQVDPPPTHHEFVCDEHHRSMMDRDRNGIGSTGSMPIRISWDYWFESLVWRHLKIEVQLRGCRHYGNRPVFIDEYEHGPWMSSGPRCPKCGCGSASLTTSDGSAIEPTRSTASTWAEWEGQ